MPTHHLTAVEPKSAGRLKVAWDGERFTVEAPDGESIIDAGLGAATTLIDWYEFLDSQRLKLVTSAGTLTFAKDRDATYDLHKLLDDCLHYAADFREWWKRMARRGVRIGLLLTALGVGLLVAFAWFVNWAPPDPPEGHWLRVVAPVIKLSLYGAMAAAIGGPVMIWKSLVRLNRALTIEHQIFSGPERAQALHALGWALLGNGILLDGEPPARLSRRERERLGRAVHCFDQAVEADPAHWQALWAMGRALQILGEPEEALARFEAAWQIAPDEVDVAREAGLAALAAGRVNQGRDYCAAAVRLDVEDAGLRGNLAVAQCMAGDDASAEESAAEAVRRAPDDPVAANAQRLVREVAAGACPRPERLPSAGQWLRP